MWFCCGQQIAGTDGKMAMTGINLCWFAGGVGDKMLFSTVTISQTGGGYMKLFVRVITILMACVLLVLVAGYAFLQTRTGTELLAQWINAGSHYQLTFDSLTYRISSPGKLSFNQVRLARPEQSPLLMADEMDVDLSFKLLARPRKVSAITFRQGTLTLTTGGVSLPLQADNVLLDDMAVKYQDHQAKEDWHFSGVSGTLTPQGATTVIFKLHGKSLAVNHIATGDIQLQGELEQGIVHLTMVQAQLFRGVLTGSGQRNPDGSWLVQNVNLDRLRLQTSKSLSQLMQSVVLLPVLQLQQVNINGARIEGAGWSVTDADVKLRNITLERGRWHSNDGDLIVNVSDIVADQTHVTGSLMDAGFSTEQITLRQLSGHWKKGEVRAAGYWLNNEGALVLNELTLNDLEYTLPENWKNFPLWIPANWLHSVTLKNFTARGNLIIDVDPGFPFQLTALSGEMSHLQLMRNGQWGIWQGNMHFTAQQATFNGVDLRKPEFDLYADQTYIQSLLRSGARDGSLTANATLCQCDERVFTLRLAGRGLSSHLLSRWGWHVADVPANSDTRLNIQGRLLNNHLLPDSVNGELTVTEASGQKKRRIMRHGVLAAP